MNAKKPSSAKKPITQKTSTFVSAYVILVGLLMIVQVLPLKFKEILGLPLNTNLRIPLEVMTTGMIAICAGYCGIDRAAFAVSSANLEHGVSNMGNPASLRKVIYWTSFVFVEAVVINLFFDSQMPLVQLGTSLSSSILLYVVGNKAITLCGNIDGKQTSAVAQDSYTQAELHLLEVDAESKKGTSSASSVDSTPTT